MFQLLTIAFIIGVIYVIRHIRKQPVEKRTGLTLKYGLYGLAIALVILVMTGRMHWIAGAIAATLPLVQRFLPVILRILPFIKQINPAQAKENSDTNNSSTIDLDQALKIFGFETITTEEEVIQRHRELIQKNHPDRGGSDFLAAQINEAKDVLLNAIKNNG